MQSFAWDNKHVTPTKLDSKILTNAAWIDLLVCDLYTLSLYVSIEVQQFLQVTSLNGFRELVLRCKVNKEPLCHLVLLPLGDSEQLFIFIW